MRIAFISFIKDPWGGSEELWAAAAEKALAQGHEVVISAMRLNVPSERLEALSKKGARVYYRRGFIDPAWKRNERILRKILIFLQNRISNPFRKVFLARPEITVYTGAAYSMTLNKELFDGLIERGIPYIMNIQVNVEYGRPVNNEEAEYLKCIYKMAAASAFVSHRNQQTAERHLLTRISNARVVLNPVNLSDTSLLPIPSFDGGVKLAIVANLLVNHKGHDLAFEMMSMPKWRSRDLTLHIYGSGFDEAYLREMAGFFHLEEKVFFHGRSTNIRQVWADNHALLLPSLNEGTPLAVVEAMLCGRPVITTDVGGNAEWIRDGVDGFIADGANIHSLDKAMEAAWQRRHEWAVMGRSAHQRAASRYDNDPGDTFLKLILENGQEPHS